MKRLFCDWCDAEKTRTCDLDEWLLTLTWGGLWSTTTQFDLCFECSNKAGLRATDNTMPRAVGVTDQLVVVLRNKSVAGMAIWPAETRLAINDMQVALNMCVSSIGAIVRRLPAPEGWDREWLGIRAARKIARNASDQWDKAKGGGA